MKKNRNYLVIFLLFSILLSCAKDDILPPAKESEKKDVSFLINITEITNKVVLDNKLDKSEDQKTIHDAVSVIVTVKDASNNILYDRKSLAINLINNDYVSASITLGFGTYSITEFILLDGADNAIFLSPKEGSLLASNVSNASPFSITVNDISSDLIDVEVLSSFNLDFEDFGYFDLDFTSIGEFTFLIDQTSELTSVVVNFSANDPFEYVIDWGDGIEELYVLDSDLTHDYLEKGVYTVAVKGNVKALSSVMINNKGLADVDFSKLESLVKILFVETQLSSLDLSYNKSLEALSLANGQLTSIDLTSNTQLLQLEIPYNKLSVLDLSANTKLKNLSIPSNQLTLIDLSANPQLESLIIYSNQLTTIDLSNNLNLETLSLGGNPQLTNLDITQHSKLKTLYLGDMGQLNLDNMDLSFFPELESLDLRNNEITVLDLSKATKLTRLFLFKNRIANIDLSTNTELEYLNLDYNELTTLDLSLNNKLIDLSIADNPLKTIEFSNNPVLKYIFMVNHEITDITILETIYSQVLQNAKANNLIGGILMAYNNKFTASQVMVNIAKELTNDFKWVVF